MLDALLKRLAGHLVAELLEHLPEISASVAKSLAAEIRMPDLPAIDVGVLAKSIGDQLRALLPGFLR